MVSRYPCSYPPTRWPGIGIAPCDQVAASGIALSTCRSRAPIPHSRPRTPQDATGQHRLYLLMRRPSHDPASRIASDTLEPHTLECPCYPVRRYLDIAEMFGRKPQVKRFSGLLGRYKPIEHGYINPLLHKVIHFNSPSVKESSLYQQTAQAMERCVAI